MSTRTAETTGLRAHAIRGAVQGIGVLIAGAVVAIALLRAKSGRSQSPGADETLFQEIGAWVPATMGLWSIALLAVIAFGAALGIARARLDATPAGSILRAFELFARSLPTVWFGLALFMVMVIAAVPPGILVVLVLALPLGAWSARLFGGASLTASVALTIALIGPALLAAAIMAEQIFAWPAIGRPFAFGRSNVASAVGFIAAYLAAVAVMKLTGELLLALGDGARQAGDGAQRAFESVRRRRRLLGDWVFVLGLVICAVLGILVLGARFLAPMSPNFIDVVHWQGYPLAPGVAGHVLGTDDNGRDLLTRAMYAVQTSAVIAMLAAIVATVIGMAVAFAVKRLPPIEDHRVLAVTGIRSFAAFPLVIAIVTAVAMTAGEKALTPINLALIIAAVSWPPIVTAARADASWRNVFATAVTVMAGALLLEATMSISSVGVQPPAPSLGNMLVNAQINFTVAPWIDIVPSIPLIAALFGLNAVGDGLRAAADDAAIVQDPILPRG